MSSEKLAHINQYQDAMERLLAVMRHLRDPQGGCAWDLAQDFDTIVKYTIEEAYEVADAIQSGDKYELKDELGDLLLQVVFHAQIAQDKGLFTFEEIAGHVADKMIERHPHVFGGENAISAEAVVEVWENQKEKQKPRDSALDEITKALPALMRAQKLQKRAARVGFEWPEIDGALKKYKEEMKEFEDALAHHDPGHVYEEYGDLMFTLVNIGRMLDIDVETATRDANAKFEKRFRGMEKDIKLAHKELRFASLAEMEIAWQAQKRRS